MFFDYPGQAAASAASDAVVFRDLRAGDWDKLVGYMREERFAAGADVLRAGDSDPTLYFLAQGEVEVLAPPGVLGQRRRIAVIAEGSVFGEIGFFDGRPRSATVRALSDVVTLSLHREKFEALAVWEPAIARIILSDLGRTLSARLRGMLEGGGR